MKSRLIPSTAAIVTAGALSLGGAAALQSPASGNPDAEAGTSLSKKMRKEVTKAGIRRHLESFQAISDEEGSRASGTAGYRKSKNYVLYKLRKAGYKPRVQSFDFPFFKQTAPATLAQVSPDATTYGEDDFIPMTYSGSGNVTGEVVAVDTDMTPTDTSTSGCEASDFAGFKAGSVALMQRGTCAFADKAKNAEAAGASAVIIANRGTANNTEVLNGTLGGPGFGIPVVGGSFALGKDLATPAGTTVKLSTSTISEERTTFNITAEYKHGNAGKVVMAGAHLDSVGEGAGINDNGSGSAALLETAEALAKVGKQNDVRMKVRFAWWGAEELGLLGSEHYVADLAANNPEALTDIRMYLNFDMVGSPNYVRFIYDGDNSMYGEDDGAAVGPAGSGSIEKTFRKYFWSQGLKSAQTAFSGRSDYGPFIAEDIPSGGLFTGAEGTKNKWQAENFGGTAGEAYDSCYHTACDDMSNINWKGIDEMSDAMAHSIAYYAGTLKGIPRSNGVSGKPAGKQLKLERQAEALHSDWR